MANTILERVKEWIHAGIGRQKSAMDELRDIGFSDVHVDVLRGDGVAGPEWRPDYWRASIEAFVALVEERDEVAPDAIAMLHFDLFPEGLVDIRPLSLPELWVGNVTVPRIALIRGGGLERYEEECHRFPMSVPDLEAVVPAVLCIQLITRGSESLDDPAAWTRSFIAYSFPKPR